MNEIGINYSVDLGSSSKYINENFIDWSEKNGFIRRGIHYEWIGPNFYKKFVLILNLFFEFDLKEKEREIS